MNRAIAARLGIVLTIIIAVLVSLFEISFDPHFSLPAETQRADPAQERLYSACLARREKQIHQQAFSTIDNPDVQREFIAMQRDAARNTCRAQYPELQQTVRTPFRVKLADVRFRFAD